MAVGALVPPPDSRIWDGDARAELFRMQISPLCQVQKLSEERSEPSRGDRMVASGHGP